MKVWHSEGWWEWHLVAKKALLRAAKWVT
jgi:hypothetical protein